MNVRSLLVALSIFCFIGFACSKKNDTNAAPTQSVTATLSGVSFSASGTSIGQATVTQGNETSYGFTASEGANTLSLFLGSLSTGTYTFGTSFSSASVQYSIGATNKKYFSEKGVLPTNGSITITSSGSNMISGTFTGVLYALGSATDSVIISNGAFNNLHY